MPGSTPLNDGWEFAQKEWLQKPKAAYGKVPTWLPAQVPGAIHLDLWQNGIIAHPHQQMHELACQWIDEADFHYRKSFEWSGQPGERATLRFHGLDTVCRILLNGDLVGESDNMFVLKDVDITHKVKQGTNLLQVEFQSAARVGRLRQAAYFEKHNLKPDTANFEERAFVRKAQYMFGWDWGPRLISCGIWAPVELITGNPPSLEKPQGPVRAKLIRQPDKFGESFEFEVDGQKLWARGANWIPDHSFPARVTKEQYRDKIQACKDMNFNMLRVWGGGLAESEHFYDACDELGILVWQDFPYACSYYPDDAEHLAQAKAEATAIVKRLRAHKCLALWCGNNEIQTMWEGKWGGKDHNPLRMHGQKIWEEILRDVVAEHDPGRPYIPGSPIGGPDANAGGYGDQHYWEVWHGKGDWKYYEDSTARFSSEFGFASACGHEAWSTVFPDPSLRPNAQRLTPNASLLSPLHPPVRWHDKTGKPWDTFRSLVELHYPHAETLDDWIYYSQLNQRDAMRHGIEHYRRSEFCKGSLIWQLNDCWPVQSWAAIDHAGVWKAAAHELKRVYADWLLSLKIEGETAELFAINDGVSTVTTAVTLRARSLLTGAVVREWKTEGQALNPGERRQILKADLTGLDRAEMILVTEAESFDPVWRLLAEPKDSQLAPAEDIRVSFGEGALVLELKAPVVDLMLWSQNTRFRENFLTVLEPGKVRVHCDGGASNLRARSLAGEHKIVRA